MLPRTAILLLAACFAGGTSAQELDHACRVASTYDLTIRPNALLIDRPNVATRFERMHDGALSTDGREVAPRSDEQDTDK